MPLPSAMPHRATFGLSLALAVTVGACAHRAAPFPETPPTVEGTITGQENDRYLVAADSVRPRRVRSPTVFVSVGADVRLLWRDRRPATLSDLRVGRYVSIWTTGVVLESRPPQVCATVVVLAPPE